MPSVSGRQHRYMEMIAHDPAKAKAEGVPQSVAKDYVEADKSKKFPPPSASRKNRYANPRNVEYSKKKLQVSNPLTGSVLA